MVAIHSIVVVTILIPNEQVAVQFQTIFKSYRFIPMLLVVAIYFIKTYNFNSEAVGYTISNYFIKQELPIHSNVNGSGNPSS